MNSKITKTLLIIVSITYVFVGVFIMPKGVPKESKENFGCEISRSNAQNFIKLTKEQSKNAEIDAIISKENKADLKIFLENKQIMTSTDIYNVNNRYYLDLQEFVSGLGYSLEIDKNKITIDIDEDKTVQINLSNQRWKLNDSVFELRGRAVFVDDKPYISLIDIDEIFNLKCTWKTESNEINLYKSKEENDIVQKQCSTNKCKKEKFAFIRLEDVTAGSVYLNGDNLEKLRAVGDLLKEKGQAFHVAWIPRYVNPQESVDNDITENINCINSDFLYTLDYLINRGAIVGLHGYTHQYGDEESVIGSEFMEDHHLTAKEEKERVESAIKSAITLNIPYEFFETPHYRSSERFQSLLEKYFNYVYEPCIGVWNKEVYISKRNKVTKYIPAPLGYIEDRNVTDMINKIRNNTNNKDMLQSFYYHPSKELDDIVLKRDKNGYPYYEYKESSILKILLDELSKDGYQLESIALADKNE